MIWANNLFGLCPGDAGISLSKSATTSVVIRQSYTSAPEGEFYGFFGQCYMARLLAQRRGHDFNVGRALSDLHRANLAIELQGARVAQRRRLKDLLKPPTN